MSQSIGSYRFFLSMHWKLQITRTPRPYKFTTWVCRDWQLSPFVGVSTMMWRTGRPDPKLDIPRKHPRFYTTVDSRAPLSVLTASPNESGPPLRRGGLRHHPDCAGPSPCLIWSEVAGHYYPARRGAGGAPAELAGPDRSLGRRADAGRVLGLPGRACERCGSAIKTGSPRSVLAWMTAAWRPPDGA